MRFTASARAGALLIWAKSVALTLLLLWQPACAADTMSFSVVQRGKLVRLIQTDTDAARLFSQLKRAADASLDAAPHPVREIATAGVLAANPDKAASRAALADMKKLSALGFAYAVTIDAAYADAATRMILGWAQTYQPSGSPVDETKLEPLFVAYGLTSQTFSPAEKTPVEAWLRLLAKREADGVRPDSVTASNNWNSHRLKIIGLIGYDLDDHSLIDRAVNGFKQQIASNLLPDGSSLDFHERDALHYHCYDLEPLLTLAIAAHQRGLDLYDFQAPNGASLRKAVNFLVPYCDGTATHAEWVHSKVEFDRTRAEAGEAKFRIGANFDPRDGLRTLELASFFDPSLTPLVAKLAGRDTATYPTWQCVLNAAQRP